MASKARTLAASEAQAGKSTHRAIRRYGAVYTAASVGIVMVLLTVLFVHSLSIELGATAFFLTYLVMMVIRLRHLNVSFLRAHADESDTPGLVILAVALGTIALSAGSLLVLLNSGGSSDRFRMSLGILSIVLGWLTLHSMLAFHYAYEYYGTDETSPAGKDGKKAHVGGLDFPGTDMPDGLSFLYFSFVVAMTAQVSDVTVTSNAMRRLVLFHGILSFFFNTVILAIAVNVVVALGH